MNARKILVASAVAWALLPACRDQAEKGYSAGGKDATPGVAIVGGNAVTQSGELAANTTGKDGGIAILQENAPATGVGGPAEGAGSGGSGGGIASGSSGGTASAREMARAVLSGTKAKGSATIRGNEAGEALVLVNVDTAPQGRYTVHVLEGADCTTLGNMETPYAGAPGKAGEGTTAGPGPKTTMATWQSLGTITVDASGRGAGEVQLVNKTGLEKRVVVLFPESASGNAQTPPKPKDVAACGVIRVDTATDRAG